MAQYNFLVILKCLNFMDINFVYKTYCIFYFFQVEKAPILCNSPNSMLFTTMFTIRL